MITCLKEMYIISNEKFKFVGNKETTNALDHTTDIIYKKLGNSKTIITTLLYLTKLLTW